jgi:hypothetical protein
MHYQREKKRALWSVPSPSIILFPLLLFIPPLSSPVRLCLFRRPSKQLTDSYSKVDSKKTSRYYCSSSASPSSSDGTYRHEPVSVLSAHCIPCNQTNTFLFTSLFISIPSLIGPPVCTDPTLHRINSETMNDSFTRSPKVILDHFKVDADKGLTPSQVAAGLEKYGKNGKDSFYFSIQSLFAGLVSF